MARPMWICPLRDGRKLCGGAESLEPRDCLRQSRGPCEGHGPKGYLSGTCLASACPHLGSCFLSSLCPQIPGMVPPMMPGMLMPAVPVTAAVSMRGAGRKQAPQPCGSDLEDRDAASILSLFSLVPSRSQQHSPHSGPPLWPHTLLL